MIAAIHIQHPTSPRRACQTTLESIGILQHLFEIVQVYRHRPERWLVVLAIGGDAAGGRVLDRGRGFGERHDLTPLEQPNQASAVVSGQAPVAWVWLFWRGVQPEQVCRRPAERLGLLAHLAKKARPSSTAFCHRSTGT